MKNLKRITGFLLLSTWGVTFAQTLPEFGKRVDMGAMEHSDIIEASGIVDSKKNDNVLWTLNDSGDLNRIFAFNTKGEHLGIYNVEGISNRDWEGMALGPGPVEGVEYLYIGEIGDNNAVYDLKYIYRVPEPDVGFNQAPIETTISGAETIAYRYPDGMRDSETLMLDPLTKDIYIVSKREFNDIRVYRMPFPQSTDTAITLEQVATISLSQLVGGEISSSGLEIIMKNYYTMYYWDRAPGEDLSTAFNDPPIEIPYVEELQGEAVCWASDGSGYYTISEKRVDEPVHLFFYPRINPASVVINEIMRDPSTVADESGEWFELYNNSTESVDLNGWTIRDSDMDSHLISQSLILSPGEYLVLGNNSDQNSNGGVKVDYQYANISLDNSDDEIILISSNGDVMDSVAYDNNIMFPNQTGASMSLLDPNMDNSNGFHWRNWIAAYGNGDFGTPGLPNLKEILSVSIKEIQLTTDISGVSPLNGQMVSISGIVTTDPFSFGTNFFMQDSSAKWSGILVHHTADILEGDRVSLTGTVAEADKKTIIIGITDFDLVARGEFGIDPLIVNTGNIGTGAADAESYEGVLINAAGVCDFDDLGFREWSINDGSGSARVYNVLFGGFTPALGTSYEVTGIQYFRDENFKILTRNENDIKNLTDVSGSDDVIPAEYSLKQNRPNPFNSKTIIEFTLPDAGDVSLAIYNLIGEEVAILINDNMPAGTHTATWNASNVSSGIYFYRLTSDNFVSTKKMLFLK